MKVGNAEKGKYRGLLTNKTSNGTFEQKNRKYAQTVQGEKSYMEMHIIAFIPPNFTAFNAKSRLRNKS